MERTSDGLKENDRIEVPFIVYEGTMARMERTVKRLFILLILSVLICFASNTIWLYWWNQYEYVAESDTYTYSQDGQGFNLIGDRNHIDYGSEIQQDENE